MNYRIGLMKDREISELTPQTLRRIGFYGEEVAEQLRRNIKLSTIRKPAPKYEGFKPGEQVVADCEGDKIPLLVWAVLEKVPLKDIDPRLLATDGYFSTEEAVKDLSSYAGYENTTNTSPMTIIGVISRQIFDSLSDTQQHILLGQQEGQPLSEIIRHPELVPLFEASLNEWTGIKLSRVPQKENAA